MVKHNKKIGDNNLNMKRVTTCASLKRTKEKERCLRRLWCLSAVTRDHVYICVLAGPLLLLMDHCGSPPHSMCRYPLYMKRQMIYNLVRIFHPILLVNKYKKISIINVLLLEVV
jgi:hypothetical protein